jgi:YgiT-type zinc finger domain-containing protein
MGAGVPIEERLMRCAICRSGDLRAGKATVTLTRGRTTVVIRETPADICQDCGEYYLSEAVTREVLARSDEAASRNAEVEILSFAA